MIGIERVYMARPDWARIIRRRYAYMHVDDPVFTGEAGLIQMDEVRPPLVKTCAGRSTTVAETGGAWLQFAPREGHYWMTAMFNPDEEIVQIYCDVAADVRALPNGESWFDDLMLDVVCNRFSELEVMDRDELDAALERGLITQALYDEALVTGAWLETLLSTRLPELKAFFKRCHAELKELL